MRAAFAALMVALAVLTGACGGAEQAPPPLTAAPPPSDPAPAPAPPSPAAEPVGIAIPSIGVDADVTAVGLNGDGTMETPDFGSAGWYAEGPRPGDPGPAVVVAHVDSRSGTRRLLPRPRATTRATDHRRASRRPNRHLRDRQRRADGQGRSAQRPRLERHHWVRKAAGGEDVFVMGGADVIRRALRADTSRSCPSRSRRSFSEPASACSTTSTRR
jgi:hypothetical protein